MNAGRIRAVAAGAAAAILTVCAPDFALAKVVQFNCSYQKYFNADDKRLKDAKGFSLQFSVDTVTEKAVLIGNQGLEDVVFLDGIYGVTFLEYLVTGAVQTTTISKSGISVHSRHTLISGDLLPSQYYGSCN